MKLPEFKSINHFVEKYLIYFSLLPLVFYLFIRFPVVSMNIDEAGQYWMAQGQWHGTSMNTPPGTFSDVISENIYHNLDPGGFTFLLYLWLKISHNFLWIKLLPLLFYFGFIYFTIKIIKCFINNDKNFAFLFIPLILILSRVFYIHGVLLRAYSVEYFAIAFCFYLLFKKENLQKYFFYSGIFCAIFLWSRYGFGIHILAFFITSLLKYKNDLNIRSLLKNTLLFSIPVIVSMVLIYLITLKYQFIKPSTMFCYEKYIINGNFKKAVSLVYDQIFTIINIPIYLFILYILFKRKIKNRILLYDNINYDKIKLFIIYIMIYHIINFGISCLGLYPYSPHSYNSKQYEYFSIIFSFLLLWIGLKYILSLRFLLVFALIIISSFVVYKKRFLNVLNTKDMVSKYNSNNNLYISIMDFPFIRYLFEEKILISKYKKVSMLDTEKLNKVEKGSIVFYNIDWDKFVKKTFFDETFIKIDSADTKNKQQWIVVYRKQ